MRRIVWLSAFILFFTGMARAEESKIGQVAPPLVAIDLGGVPVDLSTMRGSVVIINFWATWCPPCREEMPMLDNFYIKHHSQGLEVLGVSLNKSRERDEVVQYIQNYHFPAVMLSDLKTENFETGGYIPVTYIMDRKGIVREIFEGRISSELLLDQVVLPLLNSN